MTRIFTLIAALLLFVSTAKAQVFFEMSEDNAQVPGEGTALGASLLFDWQARFKLGQLLQEPVVSVQFRYRTLGGIVTLPTREPRAEDGFQTEKLDSLPLEAQALPELYDVKIRMYFTGGNGTEGMMIVDVGAPRKAGQWSFNVPASPNWGKLFRFWDTDQWLPADRAKALVGSGLTLTRYELESARLSLFDLHLWYERNNPREWLHAYQNANARLSQGLQISYGYPALPATARNPGTLSVRAALDALEAQRKQYEKLRKLPSGMAIGTNHAPYRQAVKDAAQILQAAEIRLPRVRTDQLNVAAACQAGYAPKFGEATPPKGPGCKVQFQAHCSGNKAWISAIPQDRFTGPPCGNSKYPFRYGMWQGEWEYYDESMRDLSELVRLKMLMEKFAQTVSDQVPNCGPIHSMAARLFDPETSDGDITQSMFFDHGYDQIDFDISAY